MINESFLNFDHNQQAGTEQKFFLLPLSADRVRQRKAFHLTAACSCAGVFMWTAAEPWTLESWVRMESCTLLLAVIFFAAAFAADFTRHTGNHNSCSGPVDRAYSVLFCWSTVTLLVFCLFEVPARVLPVTGPDGEPFIAST